METPQEQIKEAIAQGDIKRARELLRPELLANPSAEIYYLSAQVALNDVQKREFLYKTVAIDPFHEKANEQLTALRASEGINLATLSFAPMSVRLTAYIIDAFILAVASRTLTTMLSAYGLMPPEFINYSVRSRLLQGFNPSYLLISSVIYFIVSSIYNVYFLCEQSGQTPGKYLRKIRIVSLNGGKITPRQALIRNEIGYFLSGACLFLGFLWAFFDKEHQAWHDKLAKTVVVKKSANS